MEPKRMSESDSDINERSSLLNHVSGNIDHIDVDDMLQAANVKVVGNYDACVENEKPSDKTFSKFSFWALSPTKKWTFVAIAFANFAAMCCFSLLAPFFPNEASKKGASQTAVGLIFSTFELWIFVSSPVYGSFLTKIGSRFMFLSGMFICGSCAVLFGVLDKCPPGTVFVIMCFLVRSVEALGASAFVTASFAIIANEFPDHVSTVFGVLETFSGMGMMVGPPLGGALYELGGYGAPFWVMGGLLLLCVVLVMMLLPMQQDHPRRDQGSMLSLLTNPLVLVMCITIMSASYSFGFLEPTLANHLSQFHLSASLIGLVFIVAATTYAVSAPLWGYISDTKGITVPLILVGQILAIVATLLIGPAPFLSFLKEELWLVIVGLGILGIGDGASLVCTLSCLLIGAKQKGFEDNLDTYGLVSGLFTSTFSLGTFIGPSVGSMIVEYYGFSWGCTVTAGIFLSSFLLFLSHMLVTRCRSARDSVPSPAFLRRASLGSRVRYTSVSSTITVANSNGNVFLEEV